MVHEQLKRAREAKGLSLAALEHKAGLRRAVIAAIERGAFEELPAGLYGRHAVRAYASAVGMDPDNVLEEIAMLLRQPEDPLDGLARVRGFARPRVSPANRAQVPCPPVLGARVPAAPVSRAGASRADVRRTPDGGALFDFDGRVAAASLIDGGILAAPVLILVKVTAVAAATDVSSVMSSALPAWVLIGALVSTAYFVLLGGVRNATFGTRIAGVRLEEPDAPLDGMTAVRRGFLCALRESSILVDGLLANGQSSGWLRTSTHRG